LIILSLSLTTVENSTCIVLSSNFIFMYIYNYYKQTLIHKINENLAHKRLHLNYDNRLTISPLPIRNTLKFHFMFMANRIIAFLADRSRAYVMACRPSSVTFYIVAKRHILAKYCLKEQIGLHPETTPRYQFGPPIYLLRGIFPYKGLCLFPYIRRDICNTVT